MANEEIRKLAIVGGGRGGLELIRLLHGLQCAEIRCVIDLNDEAVGMQEARRCGIATSSEWESILRHDVDFVIEATRSTQVLDEIRNNLPATIAVISSKVAHFLFSAATERQKRAIGEIRDIQNNIQLSTQSITEVMKTNMNLIRELQIVSINASVEAARSGEHGRGFTVVASRIRELANSYRLNSEEIHKINESIKDISQSVDVSLNNMS